MYSVCTWRVFGGIEHRTQAFRSRVQCSNHQATHMTFVDPGTGVHTNSNEGTWSAIKKGLNKVHAKGQFDSYLAEYMWRRSNSHKMVDKNFHDYLASITRVYPPPKKDEPQVPFKKFLND
ncbi:hypothetical protein TNCV_847451 [Trichonephila clavipes]|nr:hypothetical protein TNCV_847451 [Trichonephila clavipes]